MDLSEYSFLETGGARFIGSNLVEYLIRFGTKKVWILDNLSNGYLEDIQDFLTLPQVEFIQGNIQDLETCQLAVEGMDFISHQAALGSVPPSISDPINSNEVKI